MYDKIRRLAATRNIDPRCVAKMVILKDIIPNKSSGLCIWSVLDLVGVIVEMTPLYGQIFLKVHDRASEIILEYTVSDGSLLNRVV